MKLVVFVNGDAPHSYNNCQVANNELTVTYDSDKSCHTRTWALEHLRDCSKFGEHPNRVGGGDDNSAISSSDTNSSCQSHYWILDDDNNLIGAVQTPVLAVPVECSANKHQEKSTFMMPKGVTDADVHNIDFRSKLGQQLEKVRHEYGATYKTAAKSARQLMNAEELQEKKHEKSKRERETIIETLESGQEIQPDKAKATKRTDAVKQQPRKRNKKEEMEERKLSFKK